MGRARIESGSCHVDKKSPFNFSLEYMAWRLEILIYMDYFLTLGFWNVEIRYSPTPAWLQNYTCVCQYEGKFKSNCSSLQGTMRKTLYFITAAAWKRMSLSSLWWSIKPFLFYMIHNTHSYRRNLYINMLCCPVRKKRNQVDRARMRAQWAIPSLLQAVSLACFCGWQGKGKL